MGLPKLENIHISNEYYLGLDGPEQRARECEKCHRLMRIAPLRVSPCTAGNGFKYHAHLVCDECLAWGIQVIRQHPNRMGALAWLN